MNPIKKSIICILLLVSSCVPHRTVTHNQSGVHRPLTLAPTLVKRGLTGQAYQTLSTASPGSLEAIDLGGPFYLRPYGPRLTGQTMGWSAHHGSLLHGRHTFSISGGNTEATCGQYWEFYKFGPVAATGGNNRVYLNSVANGFGGGSFNAFHLNVSTMQLDVEQMHGLFTLQSDVTQTALGHKVPRHKNIGLGIGWERTNLSTPNSTWTLKFMYIEPGLSSPVTVYTTTTVNFGTTVMTGVYGGIQSEQGGQISMRIALPSLYSMSSIADMAFPSDVVMPTEATYTTPSTEVFYVSSTATGGGDGTTRLTGWTTDEARSEMATGFYTVMSGAIVDSGNNPIDTKTINANILKQRMYDGTYKPTGSVVYYSDGGNPSTPLRWTTNAGHQLKLTTAISGSVHTTDPSQTRPADNRGSSRHTSGWTLHAGNVYKKVVDSSFGIIYEFDSAAEADIGDNRRYLAHPTAANLAAYLAAATPGSFWCDTASSNATYYYWPTGSGNPNSNGKVVEISHTGPIADGDSAGCDMWNVSGTDIVIHDLTIRLCGGVNNSNDGGVPGGLGRCLGFNEGPGMALWYRLNIRDGGKHNQFFVPAKIASSDGHSRMIFYDSVLNDCRPGEYSGAGGQSIMVEDAHANGDDGQVYYENIQITTNAGQIGSTVGHVDVTQPTMLQHNDGNTAIPISNMWVITCQLPGDCEIGHVTANLTVIGTVCGYANSNAEVNFRAQNTTITGNRIACRSMNLGYGANPGAGTHIFRANLLTYGGVIFAAPPAFSSNSGSIIGTVTCVGNTFDLTAATGGTTKAIWTRAGTTALTFGGNVVLFNSSDAFRLFDTITPASSDSLTSRLNYFQNTPADGSRILVTNYAGATKTLAQLVSGGQDVGSAWATDLKLFSSYMPRFDSQLRNFVSLATVPSLASTKDLVGRIRPAAGTTDGGAILYNNNGSGYTNSVFLLLSPDD